VGKAENTPIPVYPAAGSGVVKSKVIDRFSKINTYEVGESALTAGSTLSNQVLGAGERILGYR
jgi:hypothetical protein